MLLAVLAFGLALAGVGGDSAAAGSTARASATQAGAARASRSATVVINHFAFHPPTLTIAKGTKVTFSNTSKVTHTATRDGSTSTPA